MSDLAEKGMAAGINLKLTMFDGMTVPLYQLEHLKSLKSRGARDDDIYLCTFPKSGTHWVWEIINMIVAGRAEYAKHWKFLASLEDRTETDLEELESPRILWSHLYSRMLPDSVWKKRCKIVRVQRDPKDCAVSCYCQLISQVWRKETNSRVTYTGTWSDFFDLYLQGAVHYGSWFDSVKEWNNVSESHPGAQIYTVHYEDLKKDTEREIKKMAEYLECPLPDRTYKEIADACTIQKLKHASENIKDQTFHIKWNEGTSGYFRKGVVGDWKNWLTVAQSEELDRIYEEQLGQKYCCRYK